MGARRDAELSTLPAVHELAAQLPAPHALAVTAARRAIAERRGALIAGDDLPAGPLERARAHLADLQAPSLRPVINATGVIIHTNLGRAPLAAVARAAVAEVAAGYCNLELELDSGRRGSRHEHVSGLLRELTGAPDAIAVNNGAAAVLLAAAALAGPGRAIVVSRGQLVEIGGGFRIPQVIAQSGSTLIEVGTTNRTHRQDYERALRAPAVPVGAILRVHQSNFRTLGFVAEVEIETLCELGVALIDDVGSGVTAADPAVPSADHAATARRPEVGGEDHSAAAPMPGLGEEPDLRRSIAAGAALVCCSGDKLLGGPQAGLLLGTHEAVDAARHHPLARALRIDKLSLAALEATLALLRDPARARREIPVLAMLGADGATLEARAQRLVAGIGAAARLVRTTSRVGGGALPLTELEGPAVALDPADQAAMIAARLRQASPPVIARIHHGQVLLDPRTIADDELDPVISAVRRALRGASAPLT